VTKASQHSPKNQGYPGQKAIGISEKWADSQPAIVQVAIAVRITYIAPTPF
jgi:hypothetical protein